MKKIFLSCLIFVSVQAWSQQRDSAVIRTIANEILVRSNAYENLRYLCKKIGPRLSGSPNAAKAVEATARMLRQAGADTVYLQPCMVPQWIRGARENGYLVLPGNKTRPVNICALGNAVGTGSKGITAELVEVKSMEELQALGRKNIQGKIVLFNIAMNPRHVQTFRAYGESGIGRRSGAAQAAKYGAVGVMVRSLAINTDPWPHTGATQYNDSFPKIPAVAVSTMDAEWISAALKKGTGLKVFFRTNCKMLPDVPSYNVIGEIRGTEKPEEIITVGGHLDSWDLAEGAQDDGAGCVQAIEIIRTLKALGIKPKRTIRAVMFMNEENGLRGAKAYLEKAEKNKEQHLFALESDAGGFTPRALTINGPEEKFSRVKAWQPLFYEYGVYSIEKGYGGADINGLKKLGTVLSGFSPDSQRYFDLHHAATDTFEAVSKRELDLGVVNMAALVWLVSEYGL